MPRTVILEPLPKEDDLTDVKQNFSNIRSLHENVFRQEQDVSFETILSELGISEHDYILAIRSSIKRPQIFVKRGPLDVSINSYNINILSLFESNIDIQFVLDEFAVANYVKNYICKREDGMSTLLREAALQAEHERSTVRQKLRKIADVFINGNLMSAQEAGYHCLSLPLYRSSRACVYINTNPPDERVKMLKPRSALQKLPKNSSDIFVGDIFDKYMSRPLSLNNVCLAD